MMQEIPKIRRANKNELPKGVPIIEFKRFTDYEMKAILNSEHSSNADKEKMKDLYNKIELAMKNMSLTRHRFIPMMDNMGRTFLWFD